MNQEQCLLHSRQFDAYFETFIKQGITPCISAAVIKDDELIYHYTTGYSSNNKNERAPITDKTQFNIGSVTKIITATLIMKLVEQGKITLNDDIKTYINEYKHDHVTIYHLLTHTAGYHDLPAIPLPTIKEGSKEYLRKIYEIEPTASLGEEDHYFTWGYSILMDLIERVSGRSLEEFARKYLFDPLGMNDTTYDTGTLDKERYVLPCTLENDKWEWSCDKLAATGDSGLYSTSLDLLKFADMILQQGESNGVRLFAKASVDAMLREYTGGKFSKTPVFWMKGVHDRYGCFAELNSPQAVGHPGFSGCMLFVDPVYHVAGAIVTNSQKLHADWKNYKKAMNVMMSM